VQLHFELHTLPLSVLIVVIGWYGALAAAKYHERAVLLVPAAAPAAAELAVAGIPRCGYPFARLARGG
jgi:hypothetical protein